MYGVGRVHCDARPDEGSLRCSPVPNVCEVSRGGWSEHKILVLHFTKLEKIEARPTWRSYVTCRLG